MFKTADQQPDLPAIEQGVMARWQERGAVPWALRQHLDGPLFQFRVGIRC